MSFYTVKCQSSAPCVAVDDMILTKEIPTSAGSKMLSEFVSLFEAEVITRLAAKGISVAGKADVGEFAIDLLGETSVNGAKISEGKIQNPAAEIVKEGGVKGAICLDVNGSVRRAAAQNGLVSIKPTYGTVSRFGTIPVVCSGESVSVMAQTAAEAKELLCAINGHDDKDGTSLPQDVCEKALETNEIKRVALLKSMMKGTEGDSAFKMCELSDKLRSAGVVVCEIDDDEIIALANEAWNVLMCAELCNNVSRYDGVKYGYRSKNFTNLDELYVNSRTEAFGDLLKTAILYGSDSLSTENYMKVYDKSLRVRRVICEAFAKLFESFDAILMPACSVMAYSEDAVKENKYMAFQENFYTAPASITGLPAVVTCGVQIVGKAFSDMSLLNLAEICK